MQEGPHEVSVGPARVSSFVHKTRRLGDRGGIEFHRFGPVGAPIDIKSGVVGFIPQPTPTDQDRAGRLTHRHHAPVQRLHLPGRLRLSHSQQRGQEAGQALDAYSRHVHRQQAYCHSLARSTLWGDCGEAGPSQRQAWGLNRCSRPADNCVVNWAYTRSWRATTNGGLLLACWLVSWLPASSSTQESFQTLRLGDRVFTNAVILNRTATDIFVQHVGGLANVKVKDLPAETLSRLGYEVSSAPTATVQARQCRPASVPVLFEAGEALDVLGGQEPRLRLAQWQKRLDLSQQVPPNLVKLVALGIAAAAVAVYLFFCYCSKLLVEKTGRRAGALIWLPVLQLIPLLRAAGMSGWWLLAAFVPLVNLVLMVVWSFKIVQARKKSVLWAVLLLLPFTDLLAFLYLAFSNGSPRPSSSTTILLRPAA